MGIVKSIQHMLKCSVMKDQLNTTGQSWSRSVSPQWARKVSADKSHLFCLVRPDMLEADYRLAAYRLKHTAFLLYYHFYCWLLFQNQEVMPISQRLPFTCLKLRINGNFWRQWTLLSISALDTEAHSTKILVSIGWLYFVEPGAESHRHQHSVYTLASWVQCCSCRWWLIRCFPLCSVYWFEI